MAKYAIFFSYNPEAWRPMLDSPADRLAAPVRQLVEAVGGTVESFAVARSVGPGCPGCRRSPGCPERSGSRRQLRTAT